MTDRPSRIPWATAWTCAALCTAYLAFYTRFPQVADEHLALPIARAVADPTLFPATDLLVSSGLRGPFHFYRLAGLLYSHGANVDLWWFVILVAATIATFLSVWIISRELTASATAASVVTAIIAAANHYRGSLHWFVFPPPNLVTSTLATPFALAALALTLRGRAGAGLIVAGLTFNLHPAVGLVVASVIALAMIADRGLTRRAMLGWWAGAAVCAAPNVIFVALNAPGNFVPTLPSDGLPFAEQFRLYADHAFIRDHWRENYGWFLLQVAGLWGLRGYLSPDRRRTLLALVSGLLAVALVWLACMYFVNYPAITLMFGIRSVAFVKPLAFAGLAGALIAWASGRSGRERLASAAAIGLMLVAVLHKNLEIGEGFAAIAWAGVVLTASGLPRLPRLTTAVCLAAAGTVEVLAQGWSVFGVTQFSPAGIDATRLATIIAAAIMLGGVRWWTAAPTAARAAALPQEGRDIRRAPNWQPLGFTLLVFAVTLVLRGHVQQLLPASPSSIANALRLAEPDTALADLVRWAPRGSPSGALFALPPTDARFAVFRLAAGRGVFALLGDVNQLAYDAAEYGEAHRRLLEQRMRVVAPHVFDGSAWNTLAAAQVATLAREGVDYAVFGATDRLVSPLPYPVVYQDPRWIVYDTRSAR